MTPSEARTRLETMVAAAEVPVLTSDELDRLVALARTTDRNGRGYGEDTPWAAATAYTAGQVVVPTDRSGKAYLVTAGGTSHATTEPTWPTTSGDTVTDGTVTWAIADQEPWLPTWRLQRAAAEGWRWKAAKVAGSYDFSAEGSNFSRSQMHKACLEMAASYSRGVHGTIDIRTRSAGAL